MKHKIKVMVETEKNTFFGKKKVCEERVVTVDDRTFRKMQREKKKQPYSIDEMIMSDEIFDEWDE